MNNAPSAAIRMDRGFMAVAASHAGVRGQVLKLRRHVVGEQPARIKAGNHPHEISRFDVVCSVFLLFLSGQWNVIAGRGFFYDWQFASTGTD
jgi:hypothetical protein